MSALFPKGRHGVMEIRNSVEGAYYNFLDGVIDGERRQLVTRGPGKEKAATCIPICLPVHMAKEVLMCAQDVEIDSRHFVLRALRRRAWRVFICSIFFHPAY